MSAPKTFRPWQRLLWFDPTLGSAFYRLWPEVAGRFDLEHFHKLASSAVYPALDRPYGTSHDCRNFIVGEAGGGHQYKCFALFSRYQIESTANVLQIKMTVLGRMDPQSIGFLAVRIFTGITLSATLRKIRVAQNGEEPGAEICALLEALEMIPGFEQCFLHKIVGSVGIAGKGKSEGAEVGNHLQQGIPQCGRLSVQGPPFGLGHLATWVRALAIAQAREHRIVPERIAQRRLGGNSK